MATGFDTSVCTRHPISYVSQSFDSPSPRPRSAGMAPTDDPAFGHCHDNNLLFQFVCTNASPTSRPRSLQPRAPSSSFCQTDRRHKDRLAPHGAPPRFDFFKGAPGHASCLSPNTQTHTENHLQYEQMQAHEFISNAFGWVCSLLRFVLILFIKILFDVSHAQKKKMLKIKKPKQSRELCDCNVCNHAKNR